jgi:hypothetical protein
MVFSPNSILRGERAGAKRGTCLSRLLNGYSDASKKTRAAEAALIPWIEFGPENALEGEM